MNTKTAHFTNHEMKLSQIKITIPTFRRGDERNTKIYCGVIRKVAREIIARKTTPPQSPSVLPPHKE